MKNSTIYIPNLDKTINDNPNSNVKDKKEYKEDFILNSLKSMTYLKASNTIQLIFHITGNGNEMEVINFSMKLNEKEELFKAIMRSVEVV